MCKRLLRFIRQLNSAKQAICDQGLEVAQCMYRSSEMAAMTYQRIRDATVEKAICEFAVRGWSGGNENERLFSGSKLKGAVSLSLTAAIRRRRGGIFISWHNGKWRGKRKRKKKLNPKEVNLYTTSQHGLHLLYSRFQLQASHGVR